VVRRALGGLRTLARQLRQLGRWRHDQDLVGGLDTPLPDTMGVGEGTVIFLRGWCFHPTSRVARLEIAVNGTAHPAGATGLARRDVFAAQPPERDPHGYSFASGFSAMVPITRDESNLRVRVDLQARLRDGTECTRSLGHILLAAEMAPPDFAAPGGPPPRIAICMATYNPPLALFERQIESIRDQSLQDWFCFISDDGSDPEVYEQVRRVVGADPRFGISRAPERAGFYRNFERCLSLVPAGVEFVALSDQDDRWHPDKLETLLASFQPDTTLVYSDMNIIDGQDRLLSNTYWTNRRNRYDDLASLLIANTVTGAASLFRGSLLKHLLPFPQKLGQPFHDHWLACLALSMGRVGYVDRPLYDYVQHSSNVLGHNAPLMAGTWARLWKWMQWLSLSDGKRRIRNTLAHWGAVYYWDLERVKLIARVLELRCVAVLTPLKALQLKRLARLEESWFTTAWLTWRELKALGGVTETLRGEGTLLKGLLWRRYSRTRARLARGRRAGAASAGPRRFDNRGVLGVRQAEQRIAPLRLRVSHAAPPRVNLLVPAIDFTYFFGGYIAKFNLARRLADEGRRVRIVAVDECQDRMATWKHQVRAFEGLEGVFDRVEVALAADRRRALEVSPRDAFIATTWWTAHIAHQAVASLGRARFLYLIQEYEPFTFPMGSLAALARQSYDFPHFAIFSTELLRDYFRQCGIGVYGPGAERGERDSVAFANAITPVGPVTEDEIAQRRPRRLLFYARPEAHAARNMFEMGILALSRAIADGTFQDGWEFHGLGAVSEAGWLPLGGGARMMLRPRQSQQEYREFLRGHDVGLSLMYTPHPSLVPIEMASAGMLVVTNSFANKSGERLSAISANMIVTEPTVDCVAAGLRQAAAEVGDYRRRAAGSRVDWCTSWDCSFSGRIMSRVREFLAVDER
jgi:glycosyltransferase involved in cell wall biosynthesis